MFGHGGQQACTKRMSAQSCNLINSDAPRKDGVTGMGFGITVACTTCDWEVQFLEGTGILSFDNPEIYEAVAAGQFGPLAKRALDVVSPKEVHTLSELTCFSCPSCGEVVPGRKLTAYIDNELPITLYDCERTCPACGENMVEPYGRLRETDIATHVDRLLEQGCPHCGGALAKYYLQWD